MEQLASSAHDAAIFFVSDLHGESAMEQTLTDAVEARFLKKNGRVRECEVLVGSSGKGESAFLVVDNGQAACEALSNNVKIFEEGARVKTSDLVLETTTITFRGPNVSSLKPGTILQLCYSINKNMDIAIKGEKLTLSGYWKDIHQARDKIHEELQKVMESSSQGLQATEQAQPSSLPSYTDTTPSSLPVSQKYDYTSDLDPNIVELIIHRRKGLQPGIKYKSGQSTIHFTFATQEELEHVMKSFDQEYTTLEQQGVEYSTIPLPPRATNNEDFGIIISLFDNSEDTLIKWDPPNQQLRIWSTCLLQAKQQLMERLNNLTLTHSPPSSPSKSAKTKELNWKEAESKNLEAKVPVQSPVQLRYKNEHTITLRQGDILKESVDAIVNPANSHLSHGGGLAKQIDRASNGWVSHDSRQITASRGNLRPSEVAVTVLQHGTHNLNCRQVIHAVGPNAHEIHSDSRCKELLRETIMNVLKTAKEWRLSSLAIPAISSGVFGMDKDVVAEVILSTLADYMTRHDADDRLQDIRVVILDVETYYPFQRFALTMQRSLQEPLTTEV